MEEVKKKSSKLFITTSIEGVIPQNILGFTLILILAIFNFIIVISISSRRLQSLKQYQDYDSYEIEVIIPSNTNMLRNHFVVFMVSKVF